jgi:hypothetical protein
MVSILAPSVQRSFNAAVPLRASESYNKPYRECRCVPVAPNQAVYFINTKFAGWNGYCALAERAGGLPVDVIVKLFLNIEHTSRRFRHVCRLISKTRLMPQLQQKTQFTMHCPFISPAHMYNIPRSVPCLSCHHTNTLRPLLAVTVHSQPVAVLQGHSEQLVLRNCH